jgi:hypothetical protein
MGLISLVSLVGGRTVAQGVKCWFLKAEARVQSLATSCEIVVDKVA